MIRDVIQDVKNKKNIFSFLCFPCLCQIFKNFQDFIYFTSLTGNYQNQTQKIQKKKILTHGRKRKERDSNPRYKNSYNGLAIRRFSPLSHLSPIAISIYIVYVRLHNQTKQGLKKDFFVQILYILFLFIMDWISIQYYNEHYRYRTFQIRYIYFSIVYHYYFYSISLLFYQIFHILYIHYLNYLIISFYVQISINVYIRIIFLLFIISLFLFSFHFVWHNFFCRSF